MRQLSKKEVGAVLGGYALPAELLCGESLASYFSRLYMESNEELAQRDAQIAELTAENVALKELISDYAKHKTAFDDFDGDRRGIAEHLYESEQALIAGVETPATDAAANALRAEGVELFAELMRSYIGKPNKNDAAASYCAREAVDFAKQLREGK